MKYAAAQGLEVTVPTCGESFMLGDAVVTFVSVPGDYDDINDASLVLKVAYEGVSILFTGDAGIDAEQRMLEADADLDVDILKVGHHGSDTATSSAFLNAVTPNYAVISVGRKNVYHHPQEGVLARLNRFGAAVVRTDDLGTLVCSVKDGEVSFTSSRVGALHLSPETHNAPGKEALFIGNRNSRRYHCPECSSIKEMKPANRVELFDMVEVDLGGYTPCGKCHPEVRTAEIRLNSGEG